VAAAVTLLSLSKENTTVFAKVLNEKSPGVRLTSAQALASLGEELDETGAVALVQLLGDRDVKVRQVAVVGLMQMGTKARELGGGKAVLTGLVKLLEDKEPMLRRVVVVALGKVGLDDKEEVAMLAGGLKDNDAETRALTVQALAQYSHDDVPAEWRQNVLTHVAEGLKDKDRRVQLIAAKLLVGEGAVAVPGLTKVLTTGQGNALVWAARVLGEIGAEAAPAVPALEKLAKEGASTEIRQAARAALKAIQ
jgi:HEAT repeat protein